MGIRGLTTFIARESERYLESVELNNTNVVVDGNCVASHLYRWCTKRDSAFGGDYDEYFSVVRNFFMSLKKFRITPIVVMDGGYEPKKLATVASRAKTKLMTLKTTFSRGFATIKFFPLHMLHVFCEVLRGLGITIIQCEFEADNEIAALGRSLQCPVLSYDSDFYIFDVPYIPFSSVELDETMKGSNKREGLPCSIYRVVAFLKEYKGLQKYHLPILATLLGNDFVSCHLFRKFFHQIPQGKSKNTSNTEKRILALIRWMTHESETSCVEKIKSCIGNSRFEQFSKALELTKDNYNVRTNCKITSDSSGRLVVNPPPYATKLDLTVREYFSKSELPSFIMNMVTLRTHFLPLQIEDVQQESSHNAAKTIIQAIDQLLTKDMADKSCLTLYNRVKSTMKKEEIEAASELPRDLIEEASITQRQIFLSDTLMLDEEDRVSLETFRTDSHLFFASLISWCKRGIPSSGHIHALLLGFLAGQAKNRIGYFRVGKDSELIAEQVSAITAIFAPYRKTMESSRTLFKIETVHAFNSFQSILYHCSVLNTLLEKPFVPCRVADFYSGTLFYNIYENIFRNYEPKNLHVLLSSVESFRQIYCRLCEGLARFSSVSSCNPPSERRKRKKKAKCKVIQGTADVDDNAPEVKDVVCSDDDNEYGDVCNKFYLLNAS